VTASLGAAKAGEAVDAHALLTLATAACTLPMLAGRNMGVVAAG
jgi:hypothetical protein